jgi:regulator of replication initiation timing
MQELVLDLINSYEHRVITVEDLINNAFDSDLDSEEGLAQAYSQAQKLKENLRETLVRNCSLRRKDFDATTALVFNRIDRKKSEIENERKQIRELLKAYLGRQRQLITTLKDQLANFNLGGSSKRSLELLLNDIKISQKEEGEQTFSLLRDIQFRLKTFRSELADLNSNLERILERGELLKLEDLRQLQSTLAIERRKAERIERKEDVGRLLQHFSRKRQEVIH